MKTSNTVAQAGASTYERGVVGHLRYRSDPPLEPGGLVLALAATVIQHENARIHAPHKTPAWLMADGRPYFFDAIDKKVYPVTLRNDAFADFFVYRFGLARSDGLTREVVDAIRGYVMTHGAVRQFRRFSHFQRTGVLYLNQFDGTVLRLDGDSVSEISNGAEALFIDEKVGEAPDLDLATDIAPHGMLWPTLTGNIQYQEPTEAGSTADDQKRLFAFWMLTTAFADLMPTKPLMLMTGERGSGKTTALQIAQLIITGKSLPISLSKRDENDFGVQLDRSGPVALFDNTDNMLQWLQDAICAYTTGGGWHRRVLYSDNDVIEISPQAFIALASKNPVTFQRDDVADRCIVLRLESRESKLGYVDNDTLFGGVKRDRSKLYGEWVFYLNQMVKLWRTKSFYLPAKLGHRMADFGRMAYLAGAALEIDPSQIDQALLAAQNERDMLTAGSDSLVDLIVKWLEGNTPDEMDVDQIYTVLKQVAEKSGFNFYCKSPAHLTKRIAVLGPAAGKFFTVTKRVGQDRKTKYLFRRAGG